GDNESTIEAPNVLPDTGQGYLDRWMDLSFYSDIFCNHPQILDLARKQSTALGPGSEGNELGCFSPTLLYFSVPLPHALRAPLALCSPLISSLEGSDGLRRSLSQRKWKGLYHIEMSIRFPPQMRWGISHLCPFIFLKGIEARPGSRRSNNRRGAPQYTIARSNWESYYT
uniref:Uncharacterized protein n=1 Tax=Aegilops tauschii subsp. strangulata TaxID=200361 RepID=A0A453RI91_AEGTS